MSCFNDFKQEISNIKELANGWHGIVYTADYNNKKIAIKVPKTDEVIHTTEVEIENLKRLQHFKFVPKLVSYGDDYFAYSFIEGIHFSAFLKKNKDLEIYKKVLLQMLSDLYELDKFGMFKKELIRCTKNFIVDKNFCVFMIDFERSKADIFYKNIPQFLQFLKNLNIFSLDEVIQLGLKYHQNTESVFNEIFEKISSINKIS